MSGSSKVRAVAAAVAAATITLSSCADGGSDKATAPKIPRAEAQRDLVQQLRAGISFEYVPFATPSDAKRDADAVLVGRVQSVQPALMNNEVGVEGTAIVELVPTKVWKSGKPSSEPIRVLVYRARNAPIEPYQQALPEGTQIVVFGYLREGIDFAGDTPDGAAYELAPQSLHLPVGDKLVNVWGAETGGWPGIDSVEDFEEALGQSRKP